MTLVVKTDGLLAVEPEQMSYLEGLDVVFVEKECLTEEALIAACARADAIRALREPFTERVIKELKKCRVISRFGVGLDSIDVPAATRAGIRITNVPDSNIDEVSTHALAMILGLLRKLKAFDRAVRAGRWDSLADGAGIRRLDQLTLGIIGFGRVGREVARKAKPFGLSIAAYDPYLKPEVIQSLGVMPMQLEEVIQRADVLSLHIPLTPETANLITAERIARMKRGSVLVNVSRGGLVDENALCAALKSGHLAGAGMDTVAQEPMPANHCLRQIEDVFLSPHAAHYSQSSYAEVRSKAFADVARVLRGEEPIYPVNNPATTLTT
jgi:D-3-phosphoglycerate dehydrogenase